MLQVAHVMYAYGAVRAPVIIGKHDAVKDHAKGGVVCVHRSPTAALTKLLSFPFAVRRKEFSYA